MLESLRSQAPSCGTATCTESGDPPSAAECAKWQAVWNVGTLPGSTCSCTYLDGSNPVGYSNTFWNSNCELLERINAISGHMTTLNESVYVFEVAQGILDTSRDAVASAIGGVDTATSAAEQSLYVMAQLLVNLADYIVEEAPSHTQCSWIATAWQTNIETDYCMHVYDNLRNLIIGMAFCSVGMILGFFVSLDLANPHRLRPRALSEQDSNATGKKSNDNVGPQNSIQWDHPLAHPDGVVDPVTGRIRMITRATRISTGTKRIMLRMSILDVTAPLDRCIRTVQKMETTTSLSTSQARSRLGQLVSRSPAVIFTACDSRWQCVNGEGKFKWQI